MRFLIPVFFFLICTNAAAQDWQRDFEQAKKISLAANKLMVVDFWAPWCGPCKRMDRESWSDPEVKKLLEDFVPVKVNIETERSIAREYQVRAIPYIFIMDANGEVVFSFNSYMPKTQVKEVLEKYSLSTHFLQRDAISFYQHNNYVTGFRLASRYLDYSLHLDEGIRGDFLELADAYLEKGEDLLDKEQINYTAMKQKAELIGGIIDLYREDYRQVSRLLEKMEFEALDKGNKVIYAFLSLGLSLDEGPSEGTAKWREFLKEENEAYLKRFDILAEAVAQEP